MLLNKFHHERKRYSYLCYTVAGLGMEDGPSGKSDCGPILGADKATLGLSAVAQAFCHGGGGYAAGRKWKA